MADKNTASIGFQKQIWDAACVLRGNMDALPDIPEWLQAGCQDDVGSHGRIIEQHITIARRSMMIGGLFLLQFDLDFTFLVFLISHGNPKMITVPRKSKTQTVV